MLCGARGDEDVGLFLGEQSKVNEVVGCALPKL